MTVPTFPDAKAIVIASESTYESQLNPDADSAASKRSKFIDEMIALAHSLDKKVVLLSMSLPYDAARYNDADAILAAYSNKKMPVIPELFNGELRAYGPNYPAAIMTVFGENSPTGKLPVDVYTLGFGLTYQAKTEPEPEETTDTKPFFQKVLIYFVFCIIMYRYAPPVIYMIAGVYLTLFTELFTCFS